MRLLFRTGDVTCGVAFLLLGVASGGGSAHAQCAPDPVADGGAITCAGVDGDGVNTSGADNLTITLPDGAEINATNAAGFGPSFGLVTTGDDSQVTIDGLLTTVGQAGGLQIIGLLIGTGSTVTVGETGQITAADPGDRAIEMQRGGRLVVNGLIISNQDNTGLLDIPPLIFAAPNTQFEIGVDGEIRSNGVATDVFAFTFTEARGVSLNNAGLIETTGFRADIFRETTANDSTFVNSGTMRTEGQDAEALFINGEFLPNTVVNSGLIETLGQGAATLSVGASNELTNSGTIRAEGLVAEAVELRGGGNAFTNTGTIVSTGERGIAVLSRDVDNVIVNEGTISNTGPGGIGFDSSNQTTLTNRATGRILASGENGQAASLNSDDITNEGLIEASGTMGVAIELGRDGVVTNTGTISATGAGGAAITVNDFGDTNTIFNDGGTISASDGPAIDFSNVEEFGFPLFFSVTNANGGTISGGTGTAFLGGEGTEIFANNGTVTGTVFLDDGDDMFATAVGSALNVTVDPGQGDDALGVFATGSETVDFGTDALDGTPFERVGVFGAGSGADITTTSPAPLPFGMALYGQGRLTNEADIAVPGSGSTAGLAVLSGTVQRGVTFEQFLQVENDGTVSAPRGAEIFGSETLFTNNGSITGTSGLGIFASGSNPVILNTQTGTITGTGRSIELEFGGAVLNAGQINGSVDMFGSGGIFLTDVAGNGQLTGQVNNPTALGLFSDTDATAVFNTDGSFANEPAGNTPENAAAVALGADTTLQVAVTGGGTLTLPLVVGGTGEVVINDDITALGDPALSNLRGLNFQDVALDLINNATLSSTGLFDNIVALDQADSFTNAAGGAITGNAESNGSAGIEGTVQSALTNAGALTVTGRNFLVGIDVSPFDGGESDAPTVIENSGSVEVSNSTTSARELIGIDVENLLNESEITNSGSVTVTATDSELAIGITSGDNQATDTEVTITNTGTVTVTNTATDDPRTIGIEAGLHSEVRNEGTVDVAGRDAIGILSQGGETVTNSGTITVSGDNAQALLIDTQAADLINSGVIEVTTGTNSEALVISRTATITNRSGGIIRGVDTAIAATSEFDRLSDRLTIINEAGALIEGETVISGGRQYDITQGGTIIGDVLLGSLDDRFAAAAGSAMTGDLSLGSGDDTVILPTGATLTGDVDTGRGDDRVELGDGAISGQLLLGEGADSVQLDTPDIATDIDGGSGLDTALFEQATGSEALSLAAVFSAVERFEQRGGVTVTVSDDGRGDFESYRIEGGALIADGDLSGLSAELANGALLGGDGRVGDVVADMSTIDPGGVPALGSLASSGDVTFLPGSTFRIDASQTSADFLDIEGAADLSGGTVSVFIDGPITTPVTHTILRADGGLASSAFLAVLDDSAFLTSTLSYDTSSVFLTLTPDDDPPGGTLNIVEQTVQVTGDPVVNAQTVSRTVAQAFVVPDGGGTVVVQLTEAGGSVVIGEVAGTAIDTGSASAIGVLDAGTAPAGVTAPPLTVVDPDGLTSSGPVGVPVTVRREDGLVTTTSASITVTPVGDAVVQAPPNPTSCAQVTVLSGTATCTVTTTETTSETATDVTFLDEAVVTELPLRSLLDTFADVPAVVAALTPLLPNELTLTDLTPNQDAVGRNLNALAASGALTGTALEPVFDTLSALEGEALAAALDQLHPEPYDAWTEAGIEAATRWHDRVRARLAAMAPLGKTGGEPVAGQDFGVWVSGAGVSASRDGGRSNIDPDYTAFDVQIGIDALVAENVIVGASGAFSRTDIDVDSRANGDLTVFEGGLYAAYIDGPLMVNAGAAVGRASGDITRRVSFEGISERPKADVDWTQFSLHAEASWRQPVGPATLRPFAGIELVHWSGYDVTEKNGGAVALEVDRDSDTRVTSHLGLEVAGDIALDGVVLSPRASLAWQHHLSGADRDVDARFTAAPSGSPGFTAEAETDRNAAAVSVGLDARFDLGDMTLSVGAAYDGVISGNQNSHAGIARVMFEF
ncbi:MAG: autotransporter outer membrane beta-barrel domain-containing protein [Pseudomonadota bacterium]